MYVIYVLLVHTWDAFHALLVTLTAIVLIAAIALAAVGLSAVCLVIVMLAPLVTVVGFEVVGHRRAAEAIAHSAAG